MKAIVTGGTGFLGRHIVWHLGACGWDVIFTGRKSMAAHEVIKRCQSTSVIWLPLEHGSKNSGSSLIEAAKGVDAIIHCAAFPSPWGQKGDFYRANIESTKEVIVACKMAQVGRLIHISTPSIYFVFKNKMAIREDESIPPPINEYVRTKAMAEKLVCEANIPKTVILRPQAIFGPWDNTLMPRLLRIMEHGTIPLMNNGNAMVEPTFVANVVEAIWLALTKPLVKKISIYNVTNGEPQPIKILLEQIAEAFHLPLRTRNMPWSAIKILAYVLENYARLTGGNEPIMTRYTAGSFAFSQTLDISAIRNELGYTPKVSVSEGLQLHAQWWQSQKQ